jgi:hypothetical protein
MSAGEAFEVSTFGRSGADVWPLQLGGTLEGVRSFAQFLGGATAVTAAGFRLRESPAAAPQIRERADVSLANTRSVYLEHAAARVS